MKPTYFLTSTNFVQILKYTSFHWQYIAWRVYFPRVKMRKMGQVQGGEVVYYMMKGMSVQVDIGICNISHLYTPVQGTSLIVQSDPYFPWLGVLFLSLLCCILHYNRGLNTLYSVYENYPKLAIYETFYKVPVSTIDFILKVLGSGFEMNVAMVFSFMHPFDYYRVGLTVRRTR